MNSKSAVVVLGAGASADFGVRTLNGIFKDPNVQNYLRCENTDFLNDLDKIFWRPRGYNLDCASESFNVEEMLTFIQDREQLKSMETEKAELFRKSMYILIQKALHEGKSSSKGLLNKLIQEMGDGFNHVTWASFNWDCMFESSFWYSSNSVPEKRFNPHIVIPIKNWNSGCSNHSFLKLHGGINWWIINNKLTYFSFTPEVLSAQWKKYEESNDREDYPLILEPSYYKHSILEPSHHKYSPALFEHLQPQWDELYKRLCSADFVLIIGYSLPDSDMKARSTLTCAFQENQNSSWVVVDPWDITLNKYQRLFGTIRLRCIKEDLGTLNNGLRSPFLAKHEPLF